MRDSEGYYDIEGVGKLPSVTTILQIISKGFGLNKWYESKGTKKACEILDSLRVMSPYLHDAIIKNLPEDFFKTGSDILRESSAIGSTAHMYFDRYLKGEMVDADQIPKNVRNIVFTFYDLIAKKEFEVLKSECTVYSKKYRYAGTLDAVVKEPSGKVTLLDWKTGNRIYPEYDLQAVAYLYACREITGQKIEGIDIYRFDKDGSGHEVREVPKEKHGELFDTFLHVYEVWKWMEGNKK